jgi:hypothetical protein
MEGTEVLTVKTLETSLYMNTEKGMARTQLPAEAQFAPVYAFSVNDFDGDGKQDIFMGGNLSRAKPEMGIYDASYGLLLKGDGQGNFKAVSPSKSGLAITGEVRGAVTAEIKGRKILVVGRNDDRLVVLDY